jgi:RHS repeat-associated protein
MNKTDSVEYNPQSYVYNLSGALIEETYPSGRVMKNTLDQDGGLQQVQSKKLNGTLQNYANAFTYTSAGAVSSLRLGNGKFENTTFNSRLQPIQIGLGSSATSQNLLKLNFDYGSVDNNGNVKSQAITTPTVGNVAGFTATQNYTYDSLNRLKSAVEAIPNETGWKQTFIYDRYGNRTFDTTNNNTTTLANGCPINICNPTANPQDNKLVGTNYDNVGNTKIDANGQVFTYDAENKQTKVVNAQGVTLGEYFYDGDGKRIKKIVPSTSETTIFVYDASGKMVAEYSTVTASQSEAKVSYLTNDHLGSPRITTDATGKVVSRRDFMPFGEEIARASNGSDKVRQKFTGKQRDNESNLDYFEARYYSSNVGRFSSPDVFWKDSNFNDPQSWNKYVYVRNTPLNLIDPSGQKAEVTVDVDEKKKTAVITIKATFGVYVKNGSYTRKEIDAQKKALKDQIDTAYQSGAGKGIKVNGITATIKTDITVVEYASEDNAVNGATAGEVDNIVGLRKESTFIAQGKTAVGAGYHIAGENFDRMEIATQQTWDPYAYAHEFGHLLGAGSHSKVGVMNTGRASDSFLSEEDFQITLGATVNNHSAGRVAVTGFEDRGDRGGYKKIYGYQSKTTQTVYAPSFWWTPVGRKSK